MNLSEFKHPSAWLPIVMSSTAVALIAGYVLVHGVAREADEGTVAHIWQLLMFGQLPIVGWFVIRRLRGDGSRGWRVLATQAAAYTAAMAPVAFLGL